MGAGAAALKPATFSLAKVEYEKKAAEGLSEAELFSHMQGFISCSSLAPLFVFHCHRFKIFQHSYCCCLCRNFSLLSYSDNCCKDSFVRNRYAMQLDNFSSIQSSQYHLRLHSDI